MKLQKGKLLAGSILILVSPFVYLAVYHFGHEACYQTTYFLCNITAYGILYVPIYLAVAVALIGMALILYALMKSGNK